MPDTPEMEKEGSLRFILSLKGLLIYCSRSVSKQMLITQHNMCSSSRSPEEVPLTHTWNQGNLLGGGDF